MRAPVRNWGERCVAEGDGAARGPGRSSNRANAGGYDCMGKGGSEEGRSAKARRFDKIVEA